jgi:hypothetical protein
VYRQQRQIEYEEGGGRENEGQNEWSIGGEGGSSVQKGDKGNMVSKLRHEKE